MSSVKPGYRLMAESTTTAAEQTQSGDVNSVYPLVTLYHLQNQLTFLMWSLWFCWRFHIYLTFWRAYLLNLSIFSLWLSFSLLKFIESELELVFHILCYFTHTWSLTLWMLYCTLFVVVDSILLSLMLYVFIKLIFNCRI